MAPQRLARAIRSVPRSRSIKAVPTVVRRLAPVRQRKPSFRPMRFARRRRRQRGPRHRRHLHRTQPYLPPPPPRAAAPPPAPRVSGASATATCAAAATRGTGRQAEVPAWSTLLRSVAPSSRTWPKKDPDFPGRRGLPVVLTGVTWCRRALKTAGSVGVSPSGIINVSWQAHPR